MKANGGPTPPYPKYIPDNLPDPYTLSEHSYKTRAAVPRCLEIISRAVVKSLELSMALNVLWFIIYLSLCKYRYNILYMQINIPGLHKAQGHNPKGH